MGGAVGQARAKSLKPELDAEANSLLFGLLRAASWRIVALPCPTCHAGGRGVESRRSRKGTANPRVLLTI
jgi:hypothetical protein